MNFRELVEDSHDFSYRDLEADVSESFPDSQGWNTAEEALAPRVGEEFFKTVGALAPADIEVQVMDCIFQNGDFVSGELFHLVFPLGVGNTQVAVPTLTLSMPRYGAR